MNKVQILWFDEPKVGHKVDMKSKKVLGPQVENLDHGGSNLIEFFQSTSSAFVLGASVAEARDGVKGTNEHIGKEQEYHLSHLPGQSRLERSTQGRVIIDRPKEAHALKEKVFVQEIPRHNALVRIVSSIF